MVSFWCSSSQCYPSDFISFLIFWLNSIPSIFRISSELSSATWTISNPSPVPTLMSSLVSFKCLNPTSHFTCQHWALEQKISPCCLLVAFGIVTFTYIYYPLTVQNAWEEEKGLSLLHFLKVLPILRTIFIPYSYSHGQLIKNRCLPSHRTLGFQLLCFRLYMLVGAQSKAI